MTSLLVRHSSRLRHSIRATAVLPFVSKLPTYSAVNVTLGGIRNVNVNTMEELDVTTDSLRRHCELIFRRGMEAVLPHKMISKHIEVVDNSLVTKNNKVYKLERNVHVVGFGKAVLGMAHQLDELLGDHIVTGIISIPTGTREEYITNGKQDLLLKPDSVIAVHEGAAGNLPDEAAYHSAMTIKSIARDLTADDLLIVLIAGGGSALSPAPEPPLTLDDFTHVTMMMGQNGATIQELNTVRKNIDELKGGGLARMAYPAKVISLILSDVIDDPLEIIASAPTVQDTSTPQQCLGYLRKLKLLDKIPASVLEFLKEKHLAAFTERSQDVETLRNPVDSFDHVHNIIVGSNAIALESCCNTAEEHGYAVHELTRNLTGEARVVGKTMAKLAKYIALVHGLKTSRDTGNRDLVLAEMDLIECGISKSSIIDIVKMTNGALNRGACMCVVAGGETVVRVTGTGKGGRNQELALAFGIEVDKEFDESMKEAYEIQFLSAGTDGQDAVTDAAGAFVDLATVQTAKNEHLNPEAYLDNNDSYNFFKKLSGGAYHLKTGLTGTNVMDICLLLVKPKRAGLKSS